MGTSSKAAISVTAWICVTLIIIAVLGTIQPQHLDWGIIVFILLLLGIPFVLTLAMLGKELWT